MKIECIVENITKVLPLLTKVVPSYVQAPILSNILLEAKKDGLFLSATDLEIGVRLHIPSKIEEEGAVTVPGKYFVEVLNSLPKTKLSLSLDKETLKLSCNGNTLSFQTIPKDEFPTIYEEKGEKLFEFTKEEFRSIFSPLMYAVSSDDSRPQLTGVLLVSREYGIDFAATDGFRLAVKKTKEKKAEDLRMILSSRLIQEAFLLGKDDKTKLTLFINKSANQILFEVEDAILVGRTIEGDFPAYERVIPTSSTTLLTLEKEEFEQALKLASVFAKDSANVIKLEIVNKTLIVRSKSGVGDGQITLDISKEGDDVEVSFNSKYMSDFLKSTNAKNVNMQLNSSVEPGLFTIDKDDSYLYVIMPVRVAE